MLKEEPCGKPIRILKTPGMTLREKEGQIEFLSIVIRHIQPEVSSEGAFEIARYILEDVGVMSGDNKNGKGVDYKALEEFLSRFERSEAGTIFNFAVFPSFLNILSPWIHIPSSFLRTCISDERLPQEPETKSHECWGYILPDLTPEERVTWAENQIFNVQKNQLKRLRNKMPPIEYRYEGGKYYGNMIFVFHPFPVSPEYQIWMTPNYDLYWIDERACKLESFRQAVLKSAEFAEIVLAVVTFTAASAGAIFAGPALYNAGYKVYSWALADPINAGPLLWAGVEVVLSLAGVDVPPVNQFDELAFVAVRGTKEAVKSGRRVILEIIEVSTDGKQMKGIIKDVQIIEGSVAKRWFKGNSWFLNRITQAAVEKGLPVAAKSVAKLSPLAIQILEQAIPGVTTILHNSGDELLIKAGNRFCTIGGFYRVLKEAVSSSPKKRDGARFALEFAMKEFSDEFALTKAMLFEPRIGWDETYRFVDIWTGGLKYEMKSVKKIKALFVKGKKGEFGQFQRDLFRALGTTEREAFDSVKNLRWVFDSRKLGATKKEVVDSFGKWLSTNPPFKGWPRIEELKKTLDEIIVLWP